MAGYDDLLPKAETAPAATSGYDDLLVPAPPSAVAGRRPSDLGAASPILNREDILRREAVDRMIKARGEPGYGDRFKDNFTLGINGPVEGAQNVVAGKIKSYFGGPDDTAGDLWRAGVGAKEDYLKRADNNTNPILGGITDFAGSMFAGGPAAGLVMNAGKTALPKTILQQAPSKAAQVGKLALTGAGSGAIEGAARNAESWETAGIGAGIGGAIGAGVSPVVGALANRLAGVAAAKKAASEATRGGTSAGLFDEGGAIYKKLDGAGIRYNPVETAKIAPTLQAELSKAGYDKAIHADLNEITKDLATMSGKPVSWTELQNIRSRVSAAKASEDANVRRVAGKLGEVVDGFIGTAKPVVPAAAFAKGVNPAKDVQAARDLWRKGSQVADAEYLSGKGMLTAKNPGRKLETNFGAELDRLNKPNKAPLDPARKELMEKVAIGDPKLSAAAETTGKTGDRLLRYGTAGAFGGAALGGSIGAALPGADPTSVGTAASLPGVAALLAGLASKGGSNTIRRMITERGAERVNDLIRHTITGTAAKSATQEVPREALARILAAEQVKRGGSRFGSSFVDKDRDRKP